MARRGQIQCGAVASADCNHIAARALVVDRGVAPLPGHRRRSTLRKPHQGISLAMLPNATTPGRPRYVLPDDLKTALHALAEHDLLQLSAAITEELKQRGLLASPAQSTDVRPAGRKAASRPGAPTLPPARVSAIRAAVKAGVKPSVVARQFGVSPNAIRSALEE